MQGTILPGVTRKSVIQLAHQLGYEVQETPVSITEAMAADEIFTTGTAVVVSAVGSLTYQVGAPLFRTWALQDFAQPPGMVSLQRFIAGTGMAVSLWWAVLNVRWEQ